MYPLRDCDADLLAANDEKKMVAMWCKRQLAVRG